MPVTELNHFLIRANKLERTKDFYCKVLGFEVMPRPDSRFRLLAGYQWQDPGAHGSRRRAELRALLPRQPEKRGEGQLRRDRPHRVSRHDPKIREALEAVGVPAGRGISPSRSSTSSSSRIRTTHHRAQLLRRHESAGLGRRGLLEDAARSVEGSVEEKNDEGQGRRVMNAPTRALAASPASPTRRRSRARGRSCPRCAAGRPRPRRPA